MGAALLVCRLLLAGVFIAAGLAKVADRSGTQVAVEGFGVPAGLAGVVARALPAVEVAIGCALVPLHSARFGALGASILLVSFIGAIGLAIARGRSPDCHCFGQVHSEPAGVRTLARTVVLLALAGFVAIAGWNNAGTSATHWVSALSAAAAVGAAAGLVILALVGFQIWFSLRLLEQNGRALSRIEALESTVASIARGLGAASNGTAAADPAQASGLGSGLAGGGLPVGSAAPEFELETLEGARQSLTSLTSDERRLVLVFTSTGCGPCDALLPYLPDWQRRFARSLRFVMIASGGREENAAKAAEHGIDTVLLQSDEREVSARYKANGTPMALVISPDRMILSPTVGGALQISKLVAQAAGPQLEVAQARPS
jgi:thiol-disulfide isomerase/thioredoxin